MSVVPLRISDEAKASRQPRDPRGTVNIPYGYRLSHHGRTRPGVKSSYGKQSRLPGGNVSQRERHSSNQDKRESPSEKDITNEETVGSMRVEHSTKNEKAETSGEKHAANQMEGESIRRTNEISDKEKEASISRGKHSRKMEKPISILPSDPSASIKEANLKEERDLNSFLRTNDFIEHTNKRILRKKIRSLVDDGIAEYDKSIDARREKLRSILFAEEKSLIREIVDQAQRGADLRIAETRRRTEELRKRTEEQRLATVAEKRTRQYLDQCPEARNKFARKTTLETKYSNLVQMAENEAKREEEKELDALWHELMLKEVEAKKAREVEEERQRAGAGKSIALTLEKQIAGKLALLEEEKKVKEEEREYLAKLWENIKQEESSNPARRKERTAKLRKDWEEQLAMARGFLTERAREEESMENAIRALGEAELSRERATIRESTSRLRDEIAAYMSSLEEFRIAEAQRNAEIEAVVNAATKDAQKKRDLARLKSREDRNRLTRQVLDGRERQLRLKRASEEEEARIAASEAESQRRETEANALLDAEAEKRRRENALRYGQELKAQQKNAEAMRRCEKEKIERMYRDDLEREKEYEKLTEQMLNAPEIIKPHAFKILLKECAARREAKQKGLCYSSPSTMQLQPTPSPGCL